MGLFTRDKDWGPAIQTISLEVAAIRAEVSRLAERIERGSTTSLRADLDTLTGRVESVAQSMQRQFGRLYATRTSAHPQSDDVRPEPEEPDDPLAHLLEFQRNWSAH